MSFIHNNYPGTYTVSPNTFAPPQVQTDQAEGFDPVLFALDRLEQKLVDFGARLDSRLDEISERLSNLEIHELQDLERDLREAA